jgi:hypothetical protein
MKARTTIFFVLAVAVARTTPAEADCGCGAWLLTEQVVEGKPYIVVQGSCLNLSKQPGKLTLVDAAGKSIPVTTLTSHEGYNGGVQFVITPERALAPGAYALSHADRFVTSKLALTVVAAPANAAPPAWSGGAKVLAQRQVEFGCGPAKTVEVQAGADATLAFVELVDDKKHRRSGYVAVHAGKLGIGHDMCGGAFPLVKGRGYDATITLLAPARGTTSTSKTVAFKYTP